MATIRSIALPSSTSIFSKMEKSMSLLISVVVLDGTVPMERHQHFVDEIVIGMITGNPYRRCHPLWSQQWMDSVHCPLRSRRYSLFQCPVNGLNPLSLALSL